MPGDLCSQHQSLAEVPVRKISAGKTAASSTTPALESHGRRNSIILVLTESVKNVTKKFQNDQKSMPQEGKSYLLLSTIHRKWFKKTETKCICTRHTVRRNMSSNTAAYHHYQHHIHHHKDDNFEAKWECTSFSLSSFDQNAFNSFIPQYKMFLVQ